MTIEPPLRGKRLAVLITVGFSILIILFLFLDFQGISFAVRTLFAFTLFLLPGAALSFWFLPEDGLLERLATSFVLSIGIIILPGVLVLTLH